MIIKTSMYFINTWMFKFCISFFKSHKIINRQKYNINKA